MECVYRASRIFFLLPYLMAAGFSIHAYADDLWYVHALSDFDVSTPEAAAFNPPSALCTSTDAPADASATLSHTLVTFIFIHHGSATAFAKNSFGIPTIVADDISTASERVSSDTQEAVATEN